MLKAEAVVKAVTMVSESRRVITPPWQRPRRRWMIPHSRHSVVTAFRYSSGCSSAFRKERALLTIIEMRAKGPMCTWLDVPSRPYMNTGTMQP